MAQVMKGGVKNRRFFSLKTLRVKRLKILEEEEAIAFARKSSMEDDEEDGKKKIHTP